MVSILTMTRPSPPGAPHTVRTSPRKRKVAQAIVVGARQTLPPLESRLPIWAAVEEGLEWRYRMAEAMASATGIRHLLRTAPSGLQMGNLTNHLWVAQARDPPLATRILRLWVQHLWRAVRDRTGASTEVRRMLPRHIQPVLLGQKSQMISQRQVALQPDRTTTRIVHITMMATANLAPMETTRLAVDSPLSEMCKRGETRESRSPLYSLSQGALELHRIFKLKRCSDFQWRFGQMCVSWLPPWVPVLLRFPSTIWFGH